MPTGGAKSEIPSFQFTGEGLKIAENDEVGVIRTAQDRRFLP
jgi:hypothetical protein